MCFKATLSQYFMMKNLKHSVKLKEKPKGISYAHHLDFTIIIFLSLLYHILTHISIPLSRGVSPLFIEEFWLLHIFAKIWYYSFNFNHFFGCVWWYTGVLMCIFLREMMCLFPCTYWLFLYVLLLSVEIFSFFIGLTFYYWVAGIFLYDVHTSPLSDVYFNISSQYMACQFYFLVTSFLENFVQV